MKRIKIKTKDVKPFGNMSVSNAMRRYKKIGAAIECNDGKPKTVVWEV